MADVLVLHLKMIWCWYPLPWERGCGWPPGKWSFCKHCYHAELGHYMSKGEWVSEWVGKKSLTSPSTHYRSLRRKPFQLITCTGSNNQTRSAKRQNTKIT